MSTKQGKKNTKANSTASMVSSLNKNQPKPTKADEAADNEIVQRIIIDLQSKIKEYLEHKHPNATKKILAQKIQTFLHAEGQKAKPNIDVISKELHNFSKQLKDLSIIHKSSELRSFLNHSRNAIPALQKSTDHSLKKPTTPHNKPRIK